MKYKKKLILFLFMLLIPLTVCAEEKIEINCNLISNVISCNLTGVADEYEVVAIETKINTTNNIELNRFSTNSIWNGDASNNLISIYGIGTGDKKEFDIGNLTFNIINNTLGYVEISLEQVRFADSNYQWHYLQNVNTKFDVPYLELKEEKNIILPIIIITLIIVILLITTFVYCLKKLKENNYDFGALFKNKLTIIFFGLLLIFIIILILFSIKSNIFYKEKSYLYYECIDYNNNEVKCELYGYTNYDISGFEGNLENNTDLDITFKTISKWQGAFTDYKFMLTTYENINNHFKIGDLFIKDTDITKNSLKIVDSTFIDNNGISHKIDDLIIKTNEVK